MRDRGLIGGVRYAAREAYSNRQFILLRHDLRALQPPPPADESLRFSEVGAADSEKMETICRIWPADLERRRPSLIARDLAFRAQRGDWCFAVSADEALVGAVWLSVHDVVASQCPVPHLEGERFIQNLFVVSAGRNRGRGRALLSHAAATALSRGVPQLFALVFPHRIPSLRSHQAVGFQAIGTVRRRVRFHRTTVHFAPSPTAS